MQAKFAESTILRGSSLKHPPHQITVTLEASGASPTQDLRPDFHSGFTRAHRHSGQDSVAGGSQPTTRLAEGDGGWSSSLMNRSTSCDRFGMRLLPRPIDPAPIESTAGGVDHDTYV